MIIKVPVGGVSAKKAKKSLADLMKKYRKDIIWTAPHIEKVKNILDKIKYNKHE